MTIQDISISALKLPGDMTKRMASPHVKRRAKSISEIGLIHPPVVRRQGWELVAGADRMAACMLLGMDTVACDVRDLDEQEAEILRHAENAERRHDLEEERREQEALKVALEKQLLAQGMAAAGPGRRHTANAEARRIAAAHTGTKEETIRKREQRFKAREKRRNELEQRRKDQDKANGLPSDPPPAIPKEKRTADTGPGQDPMLIETFGLDVSDEFQREVLEVHSRVYKAGTSASALKRELTMLSNSDLPLNRHLLTELCDAADNLSKAVRGFEPECLCPYCKGTEGVQESCGLCCGCGWITRTQKGLVPPKFLDKENPVVVHNGATLPLASFVDAPGTDVEDPFS
jgi:ParB-like chromosome segregation protein Spo0J